MRGDPRSVLHVMGNGGRGGMQAQVAIASALLASNGWRVTVAVGGGDLDAISGVEIEPLPPWAADRPWAFVRALRRVARQHGASVVHGHGLRLAPLLRWSGVPTRVVTCHGIDPNRAGRTVRTVRRSPVAFVSCGEGPRGLLANHGLPSRIINNVLPELGTSPSSAELRDEFALLAGAPVAVLPARFSEQKNHAQLLAALALVRDELRGSAPEVLCFGDGPLFDQVSTDATRSGDRPLLRCHPYRAGASSLIGAADFFVLTSRWEGQPLVVLEALAQGLSVATTAPTGVEDLVLDNHNGRRVNDARALADVIVQWCQDPSTRPRDTQLTEDILSRHTPGAVLGEYEALYRTLRA